MKKLSLFILVSILTLFSYSCLSLEEAVFPDGAPNIPALINGEPSQTDSNPQDNGSKGDTITDSEMSLPESRIVNDISITKPFFNHYKLAWLNEFEPGRKYKIRVEVKNKSAVPWSLKLYIQECSNSDKYRMIDFSGSGEARDRTFSTENFQVGDQIEFYWEIVLPGDERILRYGGWLDGFLAFDIKKEASEHHYPESYSIKQVQSALRFNTPTVAVFGKKSSVMVISMENTDDWKITMVVQGKEFDYVRYYPLTKIGKKYSTYFLIDDKYYKPGESYDIHYRVTIPYSIEKSFIIPVKAPLVVLNEGGLNLY